MSNEVAILGAGMHPWGKWGRNFVEYGVHAIKAALADANLDWKDVQFIAGGDTMRNGYPGYVAGATFAKAMGWTGIPVMSCYAACATGAQAMEAARTRILAGMCDVALVVGADTTPKGFLAPNKGERQLDPDWLRFRLLGATNPTYFGLYARRRMDLYGATEQDFARIKAKNSRHGLHNPNARYRKEFTRKRCWPRRWWRTRCACSRSAPPATAAPRWCSPRWTSRASTHERLREGVGHLDGHAHLPEHDHRHARVQHRLGRRHPGAGPQLQGLGRLRRLRGGGHRPGGPRPGRGLRPLLGPRARLVREHRPVQARRGRAPAAGGRHRPSAVASR